MKNSRVLPLLLLIAGLAGSLIVSCGGGGGGGGGVGSLEGTWYGVIEDDGGDGDELRLQLDGSGNIVGMEVGGVPINDTGHLNEDWDENLFYVIYDFSPGNTFQGGVMIVDNSAQCAVFGDRNLFFAVLEKGATSLPAYAASDIVGNYSGGGYEFDGFEWGGEAVTMTVESDLSFAGLTMSDAFTGGFEALLHSASHGGYSGTLTRDTSVPSSLDISALVSPGKSCVAAWAREAGTNPASLYDYILIGLVK